MRIHLTGDAAMTLTDWSITRGIAEVVDCDDPTLIHRVYDGTVTITGRETTAGGTHPEPLGLRANDPQAMG